MEDEAKSHNLIQDLEQVLSIVGGAGPNKEDLLDKLLMYSQAKEGGMIGTIKHVSDGEVPQHIMAVTPEGGGELLDSPLA